MDIASADNGFRLELTDTMATSLLDHNLLRMSASVAELVHRLTSLNPSEIDFWPRVSHLKMFFP